MMIRSFILALALFCPSLGWAAYPYDSVAEVMVSNGTFANGDERFNSGSATIIAVSEKYAMVLSCQHVCLAPGKTAYLHWALTDQVATGRVIAVGAYQDIAMIICPRPKGLRAVPVARADLEESGRVTNVGYPGGKGIVEWQTGLLIGLTSYDCTYNMRPIPGMSGGATFDQYGNLIGVITHFHKFRNSGGSASGTDMIKFIKNVQARYAPKQKVVWENPVAETKAAMPSGEPSPEIPSFDTPLGFIEYLEETLPGFDIDEEEEVIKEETVEAPKPVVRPRKVYKKKPQVRRRKPGKPQYRSRRRR